MAFWHLSDKERDMFYCANMSDIIYQFDIDLRTKSEWYIINRDAIYWNCKYK